MTSSEYLRLLECQRFFDTIALKTKKPGKLIRLMQSHKNDDVRRLALYRLVTEGLLKDDSLLREAALGDADYNLRKDAVEALTDQETLEKVALTDRHSAVQVEALRKLNNQAVLANLALTGKHNDVRLEAVKKLNGQAALEKVAQTDASPKVRLEAVRRLEDQEVLETIALTDKTIPIREEAFGMLDFDHAISALRDVKDFFAFPKEYVGRCEQTDLIKIALKDHRTETRAAAANLLDDQKTLTEIASDNHQTSDVREAAIERLEDEETLYRIAVSGDVTKLRNLAVTRLSSEEYLDKIALQAQDHCNRRYALEHVNDQHTLAEVALHDNDWDLCQIAAFKLTDETDVSAFHERLASAVRKELAAIEATTDYDDAMKHVYALKNYYRLFHSRYNAAWSVDAVKGRHEDTHSDEEQWTQCVWCDHSDSHEDTTDPTHIDDGNC